MKPFPTRCIHCGRQRWTGWILKYEKFTIPVCSELITEIVSQTINFNKLKAIPNTDRLKFAGTNWKVTKETNKGK